MKYLIACIRQWWHCLIHLHCAINFYDNKGKCIGMGCYQCGKGFWTDKNDTFWKDLADEP